MSERMPIEKKKCRTPEFRVAFANVFEPRSFNDQEAKYSLVMLFDKKTDLSKLKGCMQCAAIEKWGADKTKWPSGLRSPFKNGDEKKDYEGFTGTIAVNASSKFKPEIVNQRKEDISSDKDFYSGCYAHAMVKAYAYDNTGNRGVNFDLVSAQKIRDGERFGGRKSAKDEYDVIEDNNESGLDVSTDNDTLDGVAF